jgi:hypothetical protein
VPESSPAPVQPAPQPVNAAPQSVNGAEAHVAPVKASIILPPTRTSSADGKILCPFHEERTPSCQLYSDGHYHCYGCGAHGWTDELDLDEAMLATAARNDDDGRSLARALELWDEAKPITGTLAEHYLVYTREIDLAVLPPDVDAVLRFHPRCPFGTGTRHPCLLALFRDVALDTPAGIHRIALTPEAEKIDRMMLGRWPNPRAIKLWPAAERLVIGEGIETTLAAATRISHRDKPLRPAWAIGSSSGIAGFPPIPGIERLAVLVDNDTNGVGPRSAAECSLRWAAAGRTVVVLTPHQSDSDFNDLAKSPCHEVHAH